jgi:membrane protease YdiL (CAAX protease family)
MRGWLLALGPAHVPAGHAYGEPRSIWADLATMLFPAVAFVALAPVLWVFFRRTWRELDIAAHMHQRRTLAAGKLDHRPAVLFAITALSLAMQEYFGGREFFANHVHPWLVETQLRGFMDPTSLGRFVNLYKYGELYGYAWWVFTRTLGYVVFPLAAWKLLFRDDSLLDMGLRVRGLMSHAWIYVLCLCVVLPIVLIVSRSPEFGNYYPFYTQCHRSWADLVIWESMYIVQFFALEIFFRGFWLSALRTTLGSGAIFAMCVPYCMIHFGKPYMETCGAVIAGIALGSLAMKTRSIYSGFLVHVTVALSMDLLALANKGALPQRLWP